MPSTLPQRRLTVRSAAIAVALLTSVVLQAVAVAETLAHTGSRAEGAGAVAAGAGTLACFVDWE